MHKMIELVATGAFFTFAPLALLLAVDLVCWSVPLMFKSMAERAPRLQWAEAKRCAARASSSQIMN